MITQQNQSDERSLGRHDFDDGAYIRIMAYGDLDTEEALDWVEFLVKAKRRELEMRSRRLPSSVHGPTSFDEDSDDSD